MSEFSRVLFSSDAFLPHGACLLWTPALLALWVVSDALIALAYYSIPVALIYFARKREDLAFHWMFVMFGAFIFLCGTTHLMELWTVWQPLYWLEGVIKVLTAGVSLTTAVLLWPLIPKALALPSPAQLEKTNQELTNEITIRTQAEALLRNIQQELEQRVQARTEELAQANRVLQQEIVARRQTEGELRDSEARLQAILDQTRAAVFLKDLTGHYLLGNRQHQRMIGLNADQIVDKTDHDVFPHEQAEHFWRNDEAVLAHEHPLAFEETATLDDGLHIYLSDKFLLRRANGEPYAICGIAVDITERKQLEAALQRERDLWKVTLTSIGDGVIATDTAARVTFINPVAETLLGWPQQEAVGQPITEILPLLDEHTRTGVANPLERVLQEAVTIGLTNHTVVRTRDGREVPVADSGAPIRSPDGEVYGAVLVFREVTEQREADAALQHAKEQAEVANRAKSEFLGTVSHELRTPLNVILGYSAILLEEGAGALTPAQVELVRRIDRNAHELFDLISTVLDLQRLETGRLAITSQAVSIPECLNQIKAETQGLQNQPGRAFQWQVEGSLPLLYTDLGKLKVVLKNLIGNAVKFTPQGTVTVAAARRDGGVEISVTDTGIGIPSEALTRIFEAFQQVESPHHSATGGVGLGLHIVKRLLELLGGTIMVDSVLGRGSTFRVWLPPRPLSPEEGRPEH